LAAKQHFNARLKAAALETWHLAPQATRLEGIITNATIKNYRKVLAKVDCVMGSLWTQLKMGHIRLNKHLKQINISQTDMCPACRCFAETVDHILRHCHAYDEPRKELRRWVKQNITSIKGLLAGNDNNIGPVVVFIRKTRRLSWTLRQSNGQEVRGREDGVGRGVDRGQGQRASGENRNRGRNG
jgi:hypothetical protein